jgi:hypothetical protein
LGPAATGRDIYQAMADLCELAEIARRLYVILREAARSFREAEEIEKSTQNQHARE